MIGPTAVTVDHHQTYPRLQLISAFLNAESDDDVLTILAVKEKPFQSVNATVLPDKSASEFAVTPIIGYLDFWGHWEVMNEV